MKTLRQIREDINDKLLENVDFVSDEVMEESLGSTKPEAQIPSSKHMPTLLIFRRITYRSYPKGQVVGLYYSKMIDKYLSIPFGPGGNVNLSEATVLDEEQLDEFLNKLVQKGLGFVANKLMGSDEKKQAPEPEDKPMVDKPKPMDVKIKTRSAKAPSSSDATYQSKMKQAQLKSVSAPIKENKISDIRKMIKENAEHKDIYING